MTFIQIKFPFQEYFLWIFFMIYLMSSFFQRFFLCHKNECIPFAAVSNQNYYPFLFKAFYILTYICIRVRKNLIFCIFRIYILATLTHVVTCDTTQSVVVPFLFFARSALSVLKSAAASPFFLHITWCELKRSKQCKKKYIFSLNFFEVCFL